MTQIINTGISIDSLSPTDQVKLKNAVKEIDGSLTRTDAEKDLVRDIINKVCEETGFDKKLLRRISKSYHKSNFRLEVQEDKDFEAIYEHLMEKV